MKQAAARIRKGAPGRSGRTRPAAPTPVNRTPRANRRAPVPGPHRSAGRGPARVLGSRRPRSAAYSAKRLSASEAAALLVTRPRSLERRVGGDIGRASERPEFRPPAEARARSKPPMPPTEPPLPFSAHLPAPPRPGPTRPHAAAQLLPHRPRRRRPAGDHRLHHLVVRHPGRRLGEAARAHGLSARNLPAVPDPRLRPDRRLHGADAARLPHREPHRPHPHRPRRDAPQPDAGGARHLQGREAGLRDDLLRIPAPRSAPSAWCSSR